MYDQTDERVTLAAYSDFTVLTDDFKGQYYYKPLY
jgi:hypothetical protein